MRGILTWILTIVAAGAEWAGVDVGHKETLSGVHFYDTENGACWSGMFLWQTSDGGVSWNKLSVATVDGKGLTGEVHWVSVRLVGPSEMWALAGLKREGETKHAVLRSRDGESAWRDETPGDLGASVRLIVRESQWWILANGGSSAYVSRNKGRAWERAHWGSSDGVVRDVGFPSEQLGFAVGQSADNGARVWKTEDGGKSWHDLAALEGARDLLRCSFPSAQHGWVAAEEGQLFRTQNGGASWEKIKTPFRTNQRITGLTFFPSGKGFVSARVPFIQGRLGAEVAIAHTADGGKTWTPQVKGWTSIEDMFFLDPGHGWACGGNPGWISYGIMLLFVSEE